MNTLAITSYEKMLALGFLGAVMFVALGVAVYQVAIGMPISHFALVILSSGMGYSLNLLGFSQAATLVNTTAIATVKVAANTVEAGKV